MWFIIKIQDNDFDEECFEKNEANVRAERERFIKVKDQRKFDTGKHDWHDLDSLDSLTPNVVSDIDVFLVLWP